MKGSRLHHWGKEEEEEEGEAVSFVLQTSRQVATRQGHDRTITRQGGRFDKSSVAKNLVKVSLKVFFGKFACKTFFFSLLGDCGAIIPSTPTA